MNDNSELIRQAQNQAKQRGHKIGEFLATRVEGSRDCLVGLCEYCGASTVVDSSPPPGGPKMWGDALERDCPGEVFI